MVEVNNTTGKNALRDELMASLNGFLGAESVTYIYFTEFVIQ
jgi:flagellar basal body-associated protein FliL